MISLLGGVALFLFGMTLMGDGLKKVAGNKLEIILYKLTSTPLKGVLLGTGVTAVIQSSSATSVKVVGFVNSGMMQVRQAIGIVLGSILGTSITGWILCLSDISGSGWVSLLSTATLTGIVAVAGIVLRMFCKDLTRHHIGDILLGFAVLMYGMSSMSGAVAPLKDSAAFIELLTRFSNPLLGVLVGTVFTCILQSASAAVGILQALAITGTITFSVAFPITLGIAIGAAVSWLTSYLLTRPLGTLSRASRELARGNLSYRAPVRSHDEVGQLAADFNRMAGQLEQNVKRIQESMALQERFMADFSHEMKTPMTSIIGYADLLRSQVLTPDEQMDAANYIFSEGKRLEALGLKLLDMLSLDQSKLQLVPAHPADLVAGLLEHLKRLYAQKGIALQYRTEEGACFLEPDLFKTLLVNLMDNARKALDSGGNIYVWQEMLPDGCRVRVLDNGRGIPPEALAHLTEAFYRVDKSRSRAQGGAGLGLSLCNEIVQLHGGTMQFESRVGNGTVVTVELKGGRI